jgi:hypothetical protein
LSAGPYPATIAGSGESVFVIKTSKLVYGHASLHDCLAFADGETAADEAREIVAIASAGTWGEARDVEVSLTWNPAEQDDEPEDDEPFDINEATEGDWPPMVTSRALRLLPKEVRDRFGEVVDTVHDGDYLEIPLAAEGEIVAALRKRGYEVTRDDELINTLDGGTFRD